VNNAAFADLREREARQIIQVILPVLTLIAAGQVTGASAYKAALIGLGTAVILTAGKTALSWATGIQATEGSPVWVNVLDRAVPAAAAVALGAWPQTLAGLLDTDWPTIAAAAAAAAAIAVLGMFFTPPTYTARHRASA
jgi:hypothetical protein